MIAAMESGSGKTVLTCALLRALKDRGMDVCACKCGPDYIDPMFHRRVLGVPSYNLDRFLQGAAGVRRTLARRKADVVVIEGAMGYYDGVNGTEEASAWQIAAEEDIPVLLALRPRGSSLTLAAQVKGLTDFRTPHRIAGLLLTDCRPALHALLKPLLERETGLPVVGYLPPMEQARLDSRHLGLITAEEIPDLSARVAAVAGRLEETADLDRLLALAGSAEITPSERRSAPSVCRVAVARDEAFCFYYEESLDRLRECGAELIPFSPVRDKSLPQGADGLYLGGGYPELYAKELSENVEMLASVRAAVNSGMPMIAECGGFLYLQRELEDGGGAAWPTAGILPGRGFRAGRLVRFGYAYLTAEDDSLLFRKGERIPVHEFHHWDSTDPGAAFRTEKPSGASWRCGYTSPTLYAAFSHLHLGGELPLAERFVSAAAAYGRARRGTKDGARCAE